MIAIVEHQSRVHYDMAFKLLRYIVMVLTDYEREEEKRRPGITSTKEFRYPPILPIVYYEGTDRWTAVRNFKMMCWGSIYRTSSILWFRWPLIRMGN